MPQHQGIWTLAQQAQAQSNQQWVTDPFYKNTTLHLQADGTGSGSQNQTFLDNSASNLYVNRYGNATQGSFSPYCKPDGQWSNFFTSAGLTIPYAASLQLQNTNWTIESYFNLSSASAEFCVMGSSNGGGGVPKYFMGGNWSTSFTYNANRATFFTYTGGDRFIDVPYSWEVGKWYHMAAVYTHSNTTITLYINGVSVGSMAYGIDNVTGNILIGRNGENGGPINGYISNFRFIVGTSLYTSNFIPHTTPLTAITNTQILTCQSNRFVDNSGNSRAVSIFTGTPRVQAFTPFAPSLQWTPEVAGGSAYLDGTGDYLDVGVGAGFDLGSSNFSMEFWYYATAVGTYAPGIICKRVGGVATGWGMGTSGFVALVGGTWYDSWGNPYWVGSTSATGFNASTSLTKMNQWTHVVLTRQGTDARWFVNGQLLGYQSRSGSIDQLTGSRLSIGLGGTTSEQPFYGYISDLRISIGSVPTGYQTSSTTLSTQIFTPPTSAITKTSQGATSGDVKYIGNSTNAGIYDATMNNALETVGSAQVTSIPTKNGSGCLYFPPTNGNYCIGPPNQPHLLFGTGNFTVEAWVYPTGFNTATGIFGYGLSGGYVDWNLELDTSGNALYIDNDGGRFYSSSNLPLNSWTHVAIVRTDINVTLYFNGVSVGSYNTINNISGSSTSARLYVGTGAQVPGSRQFIGYIDDFRVTKGVARYYTNFTPPQQALPRQ